MRRRLQPVRGRNGHTPLIEELAFDSVRPPRHAKSTCFSDEDSYNEAVLEACLGNGIEVVGVTDHYRIKSSRKLMAAARAAGLIVLPGFEAVTKDGVHFICLFDVDAEEDVIERRIGECDIGSSADPSPIGDKDALERPVAVINAQDVNDPVDLGRPGFSTAKAQAARQLGPARKRLLDAFSELSDIEEKLAALPGLAETLKRYEEAGLEEKLKEKSLLVREEAVLDAADERVAALADALEVFEGSLPVDRDIVSADALAELPNAALLAELDAVLEDLSGAAERQVVSIRRALDRALRRVREVRERWDALSAAAEENYENAARAAEDDHRRRRVHPPAPPDRAPEPASRCPPEGQA